MTGEPEVVSGGRPNACRSARATVCGKVKGRVLGILGLSYNLWSAFFVEGTAVTDVFKAQDQTYALHMS